MVTQDRLWRARASRVVSRDTQRTGIPFFIFACISALGSFFVTESNAFAWEDNSLNTMASSTPDGSASRVHGYMAGDGTQHVNYTSSTFHVHEFYFSSAVGHWTDNDLTALSSSPFLTHRASLLDGYGCGTSNEQHVHYISNDNHVHELQVDPGSSWFDTDFTHRFGGNAPTDNSALTGFCPGGAPYVFYIDTNGHINEYSINSFDLPVGFDVTANATNGTAAYLGSPLDSYVGNGGTFHINFISNVGDVHELYFNGTSWTDNDLTSIGHGVTADGTSGLNGYYQVNNGTQHVNYIDGSRDVHELYFNGSNWEDNDLIVLAGLPRGQIPAASFSLLAGFSKGDDSSQHVQYIDSLNRVMELEYVIGASGWVDSALQSSAVAAPWALTSYWSSDGSQHVDYINESTVAFHELYEP